LNVVDGRSLNSVSGRKSNPEQGMGGLAEWLINRLLRWRMRRRQTAEPRLRLLERIALAPRQSLALIEAEGRRILVATSPDGGPAFYALDGREHKDGRWCERPSAHQAARVSW
jgi:hypothetical protein